MKVVLHADGPGDSISVLLCMRQLGGRCGSGNGSEKGKFCKLNASDLLLSALETWFLGILAETLHISLLAGSLMALSSIYYKWL